MGRLPIVSLGLWLSVLQACDTVTARDAPMATNERSQGVIQKGP